MLQVLLDFPKIIISHITLVTTSFTIASLRLQSPALRMLSVNSAADFSSFV